MDLQDMEQNQTKSQNLKREVANNQKKRDVNFGTRSRKDTIYILTTTKRRAHCLAKDDKARHQTNHI